MDEVCTKVPYATEAEARAAVVALRKSRRIVRHYRCEIWPCTAFHVTSCDRDKRPRAHLKKPKRYR